MSNHSNFIRISKHQLLATRKDFATELLNCLMSYSAWVTLLEARRKPPKLHAKRHAFTVRKAKIKELTVLVLHKPLSFFFKYDCLILFSHGLLSIRSCALTAFSYRNTSDTGLGLT